MKTMKFRLLATIITLAAVITATTTPANAQRRSSANSENERKTETSRNANKSNIEKKSTFKENASEPKANNRSVSNTRGVKRHSSAEINEMIREGARTATRSSEHKNNRSEENYSIATSNRNRSENRERSEAAANNGNSSRNDEKVVYNSNRTTAKSSAERYNHDANDIRYKPNRDYRGSDKYWSSDFRNDTRGEKHYNRKNNSYNYNYWDKNWENYRWNTNSWCNYYGYYDPYSYRHHKYYYHHHYYGHVIRRFVYKPQIYIHNHTRYYCYDGFFFRYRSGIGYVLVDMPFGMTFEYLPADYESVYINGFLYFRVGNLFFERTGFGFSLVHYPERYYTYNDGYSSQGFRFNDMNF
jgi:hypothetical protein